MIRPGRRAAWSCALASLAASLAGCLDRPRFICQGDLECAASGREGFCERGAGVCSFEDPACGPSKRRFASIDDGSGVFANQCVNVSCAANGVAAASAGAEHTCVVRSSGVVSCWGRNDEGQLGDGTTTSRALPGPVSGLPAARSVAAGAGHSCALTVDDRQVTCWGRNDRGQLGDRTQVARTTPAVVAGLPNVEGLSAAASTNCAVQLGGDVLCWGENRDGQAGVDPRDRGFLSEPTLVEGVARVTSVSVGGAHACATTTEQQVFCWGSNAFGQLGQGGGGVRHLPTGIPEITDAVGVAAGGLHTCVLHANGGVSCFGGGSAGQLGDGGSATTRFRPARVTGLVGRVLALRAGATHTCAVTDAGLWCWGGNLSGQLGAGTGSGSSTPLRVPETAGQVTDVLATGDGHTCTALPGGALWCWGDDRQGQLGLGRQVIRTTAAFVTSLAGVASLAAGDEHTCARDSGGNVRCWGSGTFGRLGDGRGEDASSPVDVPLPGPAETLVAGGATTCARVAGQTLCWGRGGEGQLGNGANLDQNRPAAIAALAAVRGLSLGTAHACGVDEAGVALCWGREADGQLGSTRAPGATAPVAVPDLVGIAEVVAGEAHSCARTRDGRVSCWGRGVDGQLGAGALDSSPSPLPARLTEPASQLIAGGAHTCAATTSGVQCWGRAAEGQTGGVAPQSQPLPAPVAGLAPAAVLFAGARHTCTIGGDRVVSCFGANESGQLGDGTTRRSLGPIPGVARDVATMALGRAHTCAAFKDGRVACWGSDARGQLGAASRLSASSPRAVRLGCP